MPVKFLKWRNLSKSVIYLFMSEARNIQELLSVEEYLEGEKLADVRHEYVAGQVYAMAGGTRNHNRIALNIASDLEQSLEGDPCQAYIGDVKVHVQSINDDSFYYPDVMVGCDPEDNHELYLDHPSVIVEVLSESTERIDRNEKFHAYRSIPSLMEYVLVSQKKKEVMVARRENDWRPEILNRVDGELALRSIGVSLSLSRIYRNIEFPTD